MLVRLLCLHSNLEWSKLRHTINDD